MSQNHHCRSITLKNSWTSTYLDSVVVGFEEFLFCKGRQHQKVYMLTSSEFLWYTFSTCIYLFNWPLQYICIIKTGTWIHCYIWPSQLPFYWDEKNVVSYWSIHFVTTAHILETPNKQSTNEPWKWVAEHSQKCYGTPSSKWDYCTDLHIPSCNMQHTWRNVHGTEEYTCKCHV